MLTDRENKIRAWRRQGPESIPISSGLPFLDWPEFGYDLDELESVCLRHPILLPGFERGSLARSHDSVPMLRPDLVEGQPYTDYWGCVWTTVHTGMVGAVTHHPLADMSRFNDYRAPDPEKTDGMRALNWDGMRKGFADARAAGHFTGCGLPHGHTFLRAQDIRGYQDFICDMSDEAPEIAALLDMISDFNFELISRMIALKPDMISIPEDLGMQNSPMITPGLFSKYIAPIYYRLTGPIKEAGIIVHEHSDGFILPLLDDLIRTGGDVLNIQDLVNGLDNIQREAKGRVAIDLDIDRQHITVNGSAKDIDDHVRECVMKLGSREGGLSLCYQPWPPTSPGNMDAVFTAMEKHCVTDYPFR
jgi:hypothetical protein